MSLDALVAQKLCVITFANQVSFCVVAPIGSQMGRERRSNLDWYQCCNTEVVEEPNKLLQDSKMTIRPKVVGLTQKQFHLVPEC